MSNLKRVFIAIPISQQLQSEVLNWVEQSSLKNESAIRWLSGKNLHITLVPPWETDRVDEIVEKLLTIKHQSFSEHCTSISFGPNEKDPRLVWATGNASHFIQDLRLKIYKALNRQINSRSFNLHMTLGRFRPEAFSHFEIKTLHEKINWELNVSSFVLMQSHLYKTGAEYKALQEFNV